MPSFFNGSCALNKRMFCFMFVFLPADLFQNMNAFRIRNPAPHLLLLVRWIISALHRGLLLSCRIKIFLEASSKNTVQFSKRLLCSAEF